MRARSRIEEFHSLSAWMSYTSKKVSSRVCCAMAFTLAMTPCGVLPVRSLAGMSPRACEMNTRRRGLSDEDSIPVCFHRRRWTMACPTSRVSAPGAYALS